MPKISIIVLLYNLHFLGDSFNFTQELLAFVSLLSLLVGSTLGLAQIHIKRLLAYSSVSHIGIMLLAIAIASPESTEAFLFYLIQYSFTSINLFFIILAFGYTKLLHKSSDISLIKGYAGLF